MTVSTPDRRRFLRRCTQGLLALITSLVAVPVVAYVVAPLRRHGAGKQGELVDIGPLAELPMGKWLLLPVEIVLQDGWEKVHQRHSVWVRRLGDSPSQISVLSPLCPHLGCPVNWLASENQFKCPCHGGVFSANGAHVSGPPPRSLDPLSFEIRAGRLWVRWEDFKIGVAEQIPVRV